MLGVIAVIAKAQLRCCKCDHFTSLWSCADHKTRGAVGPALRAPRGTWVAATSKAHQRCLQQWLCECVCHIVVF